MDKTKTVWPKWTFDRPSKEVETFGARPRIVVTGAIAHGYVCFLAPDELPHGADAYCEVVCQVIQEVKRVLGPWSLPPHLVLQVDNTPSKKRPRGLIQQLRCGQAALPDSDGRAHEDIDQAFSLLVSQVIRRYRCAGSPAVCGNFKPRGETFLVRAMTAIRKFTEWLAPLRITQHGCWQTRDGTEAPHSFSYKLYMDLSSEEQQSAERHRWFGRAFEASGKDVMCCVKQGLHAGQAAATAGCVGPSMKDSEKERFLACATSIDSPLYGYHKAAAGLRPLVQQCGQQPVVEQRPDWLSNPVAERQPLDSPDSNPFLSHLPETSWHMQVRTRR